MIRALLVMVSVTVALVACGARSTLQDDGGGGAPGGGGSGETRTSARSASTQASISSSSGGTTWTGVPATCNVLQLIEPVVVADTQGPARAPQIATLPDGQALLTWLRDFELEGSAIPAFTTWPTGLATVVPLAGGVESFSLGQGHAGTTAHVMFTDGSAWIAESVWPNVVAWEIAGMINGASLFVAGLELTWLFGEVADFGAIAFRSFGNASFVQTEEPTICSSRPLGAAAPSNGAILATFAEKYVFDFCDTGKAWPDVITTARYDLVPSFDDPLERTSASSVQTVEPIYSLTMAPTSFGAWVVFQTDGTTSRLTPPVTAFRIDQNAIPIGRDDFTIPVSPTGRGLWSIAAASMGDALAVAWVEALDPSNPTIVVQRVEADETLGASVVVPTQPTWPVGKIELLAAPNQKQLLLAWEGGQGDLGLARIDCASGAP